jgi:glutaredoxin 3
MAKRLLGRAGFEFEEINASADPELRHWLVQTTGQRTVPQIFFDDESIGGYQELVAIERSGGLAARLEKS